MLIHTRKADGVVVLDIAGDLTFSEGVTELRTRVQELVEGGDKNILVNAADVDYVDSCGVGELVRSYTTVRKQGGHIKLLNPTHKLQELLVVTKLLMIFDTFDDERKALDSFGSQ